MTGTNFDQYEGAQGICPTGGISRRWPSGSSWRVSAAAACPTRHRPISKRRRAAVRLPALNKDGFNIAGCGYINATSATATPAYMATTSAADASAFGMGYFPRSTGYKVTYNTADDPGKRHQEHPVLCRYDNLQQELQSHDNRLPGWLWRCPGSLYQEQGVILTPAHKHTQHKQQ